MADFPSLDDSFALLHAAGWSDGDARLISEKGPVWMVSGTNGENKIEARGATQAEAWHRAVEQTRSLGMLDRHATL